MRLLLRRAPRRGFLWALGGTLLLLGLLAAANQRWGRPLGAPCADSYACRWGRPGGVECVEVDGESYCTTYCKADHTCPAGWSCGDANPTVLTLQTKVLDKVCLRPSRPAR